MLTKQKIAQLKKLHTKKGREESGTFILEGWKSIQEAVNAGTAIELVVYDEQKIENKQLLTKLERLVKEVVSAKSKELGTISDTVSTQGIIAVLPKFSGSPSLSSLLRRQKSVIVAIDGISDPGNLGTIIRTCDWFGVDALIIGNTSVELYNPKVVRASMGSLFHLPIVEDANLIDILARCRTEHFSIYSTGLTRSVDIRNIAFSEKAVIVIGSESHGVSPEIAALADKQILIPRFGKADSLNAAMACGIILSHITL